MESSAFQGCMWSPGPTTQLHWEIAPEQFGDDVKLEQLIRVPNRLDKLG